MKFRITSLLAGLLISCCLFAQEGRDPRMMTLVTLHLKAATPDHVFESLGSAGKIKFVFPRSWGKGKDILANVDMTDRPFWLAALQLGGAYGYTFDTASFTPADKRIRIQLSPPLPERKILQAPPLYLMAQISKSQHASADLVVYADPTLEDWVFATPVDITQATDEAGQSVLAEQPADRAAPPPGMVSRHPIQLTKPTGRLASLKGTLVLLKARKVDVWDIPLPVTGPLERKIDKTTYTVLSMTRSQNRFELKLRVKGPADGGFKQGAAQLAVGPQSIIATDPAGTPWHLADTRASYKSKTITAVGEYEGTLTLIPERSSGATEISRLTWRLPTAMENLELPFEFTDVSLR